MSNRHSREAAAERVSRRLSEKLRDQDRRGQRRNKDIRTNFAVEYGVMVEAEGERHHRGKSHRHC